MAGCQQKVYKKIYHKPSHPITCLRLEAKNPITAFMLKKEYPFSTSCPFRLRTLSHYVTTCTSAKAKALGTDFDGYLRLELYEGNRLLYRNQQDFKGCLRQNIVHTLFRALRRDMNF